MVIARIVLQREGVSGEGGGRLYPSLYRPDGELVTPIEFKQEERNIAKMSVAFV